MAVGPLIQSIVNGNPVTADKVYGNDVAIRDFVASLPNENLQKPMAMASVLGSLERSITINASSVERHHFGYSQLPSTLSEAVSVLGISCFVVLDQATIVSGTSIEAELEYYNGSLWTTVQSCTLDHSSYAASSQPLSNVASSEYGYLSTGATGGVVPAGSKIRFTLQCTTSVAPATIVISGAEVQAFLKARHQAS